MSFGPNPFGLGLSLVASYFPFLRNDDWVKFAVEGLNAMVIQDDDYDYCFALQFLAGEHFRKDRLNFLDISGSIPNVLCQGIAQLPLKRLAIEPRNLFENESIANMLRSLNLQDLEIRCPAESAGPCIFKRSSDTNRANCKIRDVLRSSCPNLDGISLCCRCGTHEMGDEIIGLTHCLRREVNIHIATTSTTIESIRSRLPSVSTVEFTLDGDRDETMRMMPSRSVLLRGVHIRRAQDRDVVALASFHYLKDIRLEVMDGAESMLSVVSFPSTVKLHISASPSAVIPEGRLYYTLEMDAIHRSITLAPYLRAVSLVHCRIDGEEIRGILRHIGLELRSFETSMLGQRECPSVRLLNLIETMVEYNPRIEAFVITDDVSDDTSRKMIFGTETYGFLKHVYSSVYKAHFRLIKQAPMLQPWSMIKAVSEVFPEPAYFEADASE